MYDLNNGQGIAEVIPSCGDQGFIFVIRELK